MSWLIKLSLGIGLAFPHEEPTALRHFLPLGIDLVSLDVPAGLLILRKSELEHGEFDIRRVGGTRVMRIIIDQGLDQTYVDQSKTRYCINGVSGETAVKNGLRKVLLHLPPGEYENNFYFEYSESDKTAVNVMKTFRLKGNSRRC